jgi:hypothetical protein
MRIYNGEITTIGSWNDAATGVIRDKLRAISDHEPKYPVEFYTKGAAEFYLWVIDERVAGRKLRTGH